MLGELALIPTRAGHPRARLDGRNPGLHAGNDLRD
jgi:hypothetical protein